MVGKSRGGRGRCGERLTNAEKPRVCVISGGPSGEAEVSRSCAAVVHAGLASQGLAAAWIDLRPTGRWDLKAAHPSDFADRKAQGGAGWLSWQEQFLAWARSLDVDVAFPVIHGTIGEDGQIQALCEAISLPYVGSGPEASIRCYDKVAFKALASSAGLPVVDGLCVSRACFKADPARVVTSIAERVGVPCIVKPARSGSSLGLARVDAPKAASAALRQALEFDDIAIVERLVEGMDVEVGVYGGCPVTVGLPTQIQPTSVLYDFDAKYGSAASPIEVPANFDHGLTAELMEAARIAFLSTECRGLARVDFLVDPESGRFVVNELNTIPYLSDDSSVARSLLYGSGVGFPQLLVDLVSSARRGRA